MKIRIQYPEAFYRKMRKLIKRKPQIATLYRNAIILLSEYPPAMSLKVHKLTGDLKNKWAFSLTHDLRVVFEKRNNEIWFLDIGSHDEVY